MTTQKARGPSKKGRIIRKKRTTSVPPPGPFAVTKVNRIVVGREYDYPTEAAGAHILLVQMLLK